MSRFDVIVIGCGPGGERAAIQAARAGKRVAVIERAHVVGGTRVNWGTIPSKTLRQSAIFVLAATRRNLEGFNCRIEDKLSVHDFMYRERLVVQRELELINRSLDRYEIEVFQGSGRFEDAHTVSMLGVDGRTRIQLEGDVIVIAVGTTPNHPPDVPFDGELVFDSDTILSMPAMPRSMVVLGAGVIAVEYAAIFAALGIQVTMVDTRDALLPYLDREIAAILERELRKLGIVVIHDDHHATIERPQGRDTPHVRCTTRQGNVLESDVLLYAVGRDGSTRGLGLERIGVEPSSRGLIAVNADYQIEGHPHIYAVGDVVGYPALASTSMEQGRQAIRHAFGIGGPRVRSGLLPFAIYAIPEVSYIGETEESARSAGMDVVIGRGRYDMNPRGQILGDTGGLLKLVVERPGGRVLGVHIIGSSASELIHLGQNILYGGQTVDQIAEQLFNYPTLSDLYRHAALEACRELAG